MFRENYVIFRVNERLKTFNHFIYRKFTELKDIFIAKKRILFMRLKNVKSSYVDVHKK